MYYYLVICQFNQSPIPVARTLWDAEGLKSSPHLRLGPPRSGQVKRILARESIWWQICRQSVILNHRFELDNRRFGLDNWGWWAAPCLRVQLPPDVIISGRGCFAKCTEKHEPVQNSGNRFAIAVIISGRGCSTLALQNVQRSMNQCKIVEIGLMVQ